MTIREFIELIIETFKHWKSGQIARLGAALAYYAAFSFIPMLVVAVVVASVLFSENEVENRIIQQIRDIVGSDSAQTVRDALNAVNAGAFPGTFTTIISIGALLYGATGLFRNLKGALNAIWKVSDEDDNQVRRFIRDTIISFVLVIALGVLLLMVFIINTVLFVVVRSLDSLYPELQYIRIMQGVGLLVLFAASVVLFGVIYRYLPSAHVEWKDVWIGATMTAMLFSLGQLALSILIRPNQLESIYGAASALILLLIWVYTSARLVLFGAVFTCLYANRLGSKIISENDYQQEQKAM
jgi:membrane protein